MIQTNTNLDPITFEILRHKLWAINDEQSMTLMRCSCSNVANDIKDMNCALLTAEGDVFTLGTYIAMHGLTLSFIAKDILENYKENPGINPGDMFICNDPYVGACHQNDVTVLKPIFWKDELIMWAGSCLHVFDVGGPNVGSVQIDAKDIYMEQPIFPPIKIVENNIIRKDIEREYIRRCRIPNMVALDLRAKVAANITAEKRIFELIETRSLETIKATINKLIETTEIRMRELLNKLPDGMWAHRGYLDTDEDIYKTVLEMTKTSDKLIFDFTKSDDQAPAIFNTTYPGLVGRAMTAVLAMLCYDIGWCAAGVMKVIEIKSKPGTIVHCEWPAGCCKATTAASWEVDNLVAICIGKMLASSEEYHPYFQSGWMGSQAIDDVAGTDRKGESYEEAILDSMFGGTGARSTQDGIDTGGFLCSISLGVANVETYENLTALQYLYRRQKPDSGGAGTFRGGATVEVAYYLHEGATQENKIMSATGVSHPASSGIYGGYPSNNVQLTIARNSDIRELLKDGKIPSSVRELSGTLERFAELANTYLGHEDVYELLSTGGGGYGDPLERSPELVLQDYKNFLVTQDGASNMYGVELSNDGESIDLQKTEKQRQKIRKKRIGKTPTDSTNAPIPNVRGRINNYLNLVESEGDTIIICRCGHKICEHNKNHKEHVVYNEFPITSAGMHIDPAPQVPDKKFVWREFYCPNCALLLTNEVALESDPILWEVNLKLN